MLLICEDFGIFCENEDVIIFVRLIKNFLFYIDGLCYEVFVKNLLFFDFFLFLCMIFLFFLFILDYLELMFIWKWNECECECVWCVNDGYLRLKEYFLLENK